MDQQDISIRPKDQDEEVLAYLRGEDSPSAPPTPESIEAARIAVREQDTREQEITLRAVTVAMGKLGAEPEFQKSFGPLRLFKGRREVMQLPDILQEEFAIGDDLLIAGLPPKGTNPALMGIGVRVLHGKHMVTVRAWTLEGNQDEVRLMPLDSQTDAELVSRASDDSAMATIVQSARMMGRRIAAEARREAKLVQSMTMLSAFAVKSDIDPTAS